MSAYAEDHRAFACLREVEASCYNGRSPFRIAGVQYDPIQVHSSSFIHSFIHSFFLSFFLAFKSVTLSFSFFPAVFAVQVSSVRIFRGSISISLSSL
jgi:hypothetical protein